MSQNARLLINIIIDNSSSMKGEKLQKLKSALGLFHDSILASKLDFLYSVIGYKGFQAAIFKSYDDEVLNLDDIYEGGLALLGKAVLLGVKTLEEKLITLRTQGCKLYKPWFVILSDGQCYGELDSQLEAFKDLYKKQSITYFPFLLSNNPLDEKLTEFQSLKRPLVIANLQYDKLFKWLFETLKLRITTQVEQTIRLTSTAFDGWVIK
jgi:uncharacterized protein YegL